MDDLILFKILSIAGALAWLPPLISFILKKYRKPKLNIYSDNNLEIGFTTNGPIINIGLAFTADNKNALINKIKLILKHENQETRIFEWEWFEENLMQLIVPNQGILPYNKNQQAIAISVRENEIIEKKFGFKIQDIKLKRKEFVQN